MPTFPTFPKAESVLAAEPEVLALVFAAAEPTPEVPVSAGEPEVA